MFQDGIITSVFRTLHDSLTEIHRLIKLVSFRPWKSHVQLSTSIYRDNVNAIKMQSLWFGRFKRFAGKVPDTQKNPKMPGRLDAIS